MAFEITRRKSRQIHIGSVAVGGDAPVSVQSMTTTDTADVDATVAQIARLEAAGCEIVRVAVPDPEAAKAIGRIKSGIAIPLIADIHFNWRLAVAAMEAGADGLRINPGNIGGREKTLKVIDCARQHQVAIRIGVNSGSVEKDLLKKHGGPTPRAMVESALRNIAIFEAAKFFDIKLSIKASDVARTVESYRLIAAACDYPLHVGVTEAGGLFPGLVKSSLGIGMLLAEGVGDTIRVSLTPEPNGDRTLEVQVAQEILQSMGLRAFMPMVIACPGCGRTTSTYFQQLAQDIQGFLREQMPRWREQYPGVEEMDVAVMGCVVNGPGESKHANIGISLPGTGERPAAPVYVDGAKVTTLKGDSIAADFQRIVEDYVVTRYRKAGV